MCHSENHATSQIWKALPNMVFPPIWGKKMASFWACACKLSWTLLSLARVQPLYWAGRKESSGTGLGSSQVPIFFLVFFFDYTYDVRAVTRNSNFPVVDIFHSRSKEPLPLRIAVASPRYTTTFNINIFSKNTKGNNLPMAEEHAPYTWYTGNTDGKESRRQEYLTFAPEKINTIDPIPSPVSIKEGWTTMVAENCQSKNPYFEGKIVVFVTIFSFVLYVLFYFSSFFLHLILY